MTGHQAIRTIAFILFCSQSLNAQYFPSKEWRAYTDPVDAGFSSEKLQQAKQYFDSSGFAAGLIIHKGLIVADWGENTRRFMLASIRKSLLNALIGRAIDSHQLALDATLDALKLDDATPLTTQEKKATLKMLLTSTSGVFLPSAFEFKGWKDLKPARESHEPGTFWYYNNWDFNALGAAYEKATGKEIFKAFIDEVAQPIGMQDFRLIDGVYLFEAESLHPAYLFKMSSRDLARFGLLYLNHGKWENNQLLSEQWVNESTISQAIAYNDHYGYLWWTTPVNNYDAFTAHGAGTHIMTVIPELDLVVVVRTNDYQRPITTNNDRKLVAKIAEAKQNVAKANPNLVNHTWREQSKPQPTGHRPDPSMAGSYNHDKFGKFNVSVEQGQWMLKTNPVQCHMIIVGANEFFIEDINLRAEFIKTSDLSVKGKVINIRKPETNEVIMAFYY